MRHPIRSSEAAELVPLTPVVLHILLALADDDRHGYAIAQEVERLTVGELRLGPGTLYGSIRRLQAAGLIEESTADRPPDPATERRRYYRLLPLGRHALELELQRLARLVAIGRAKRLLDRPEPA
jgi:DNA-binding PadR family transcriptional regulator